MTPYTIQKTIHHGYGLAQKDDGKTVLVEGALPGEEVICKIVSEKKQYDLAKIKEILRKNPERISPPCPYINECGGCNLQHASYFLQTEIKADIVRDILQRSGVKDLQDISSHVHACTPSKDQFHYRQRIRLHLDTRGRFGFLRKKSNDIIEIDHCLIAKKEINTALKGLRASNSFIELAQKTSQLQILFNPLTKKVILVFTYERKPRPTDIQNAKRLTKELEMIESVYFQGENFPLSDPITIHNMSSDDLQQTFTIKDKQIMVSWEVGGFCQVNLDQNHKMIETALEFAQLNGDENVLDLYCGMGNFSLPFALSCQTVTGYEGQGAAIRAAKKNAEENKLNNASFYKMPVHSACEALIKEQKVFDITIIDPPRQGAPDLADKLAALTKKKILYISCDPATLSRDLEGLVKNGFRIEQIQPIDMFPQTHHIETIVLLKKIR